MQASGADLSNKEHADLIRAARMTCYRESTGVERAESAHQLWSFLSLDLKDPELGNRVRLLQACGLLKGLVQVLHEKGQPASLYGKVCNVLQQSATQADARAELARCNAAPLVLSLFALKQTELVQCTAPSVRSHTFDNDPHGPAWGALHNLLLSTVRCSLSCIRSKPVTR
jgi:hypothetical protein